MIVLAYKGQSLQIPSAKAGKYFAGLKLDVDLVTDKATDLVDLIAVIDGDSNAAVNDYNLEAVSVPTSLAPIVEMPQRFDEP
jgi:hypothetical protein